jgi:hypothetical protein
MKNSCVIDPFLGNHANWPRPIQQAWAHPRVMTRPTNALVLARSIALEFFPATLRYLRIK